MRQFGGDALPDVDDSFHMIDEIPSLQVSYKMADAHDYISYPHLSVGFFQSSSHFIQDQQFFVSMLDKGLGRLGTYGSG